MVKTSYGVIPDAELCSFEFPDVPTVSLPVQFEGCPTRLSPRLAYFAGFFFGDGGLKDIERSFLVSGRREYKIIIADEFESQVKVIQRLFENLFGFLPPIRYEKWARGENAVYINPTCKRVYLFLTTVFELPKGSKTADLHLPALILSAPKELQQWFLRGLFDAEGDTRAVEKEFSSAPRIKIRMKCIPFVFGVKKLFESAFEIPVNGLYFDKGNVSAYFQVNWFVGIIRLSEQNLFLHPIKRWRLEKTAAYLRTRSRFFKRSFSNKS